MSKNNKIKKIVLASDHAGFKLKENIKFYLRKKMNKVIDLGTNSTDSVDYPDYAHLLSKKMKKNNNQFGILICGTGIGMSITANRIQGVRCGIATNTEMAKMARLHNNCQVLAVGSRISTQAEIETIVSTFIGTPFDTVNTRHKNRINLIDI